MKKIIMLAITVVSTLVSNAQQSSVTAVVTNYGVSPVPVFTLGDPAATIIFGGYLIRKKMYSLEVSPTFAFNLTNGQGWTANNWLILNKKFDTAGHWIGTAAFNWSFAFNKLDDGTTKAIPYPTERIALQYIPNGKNSFDIEYWYTKAIPLKYGVKGGYTSFSYTRNQQVRSVTFSGNINVFNLDYSDGTRGFASAYNVTVFHKTGLFIGGQYMKNINAAYVADNKNFFIGYKRKI